MTNETNQTTLFDTTETPAVHESSNGYSAPHPRRPLGECGRWLSGGTPSRSTPEYWGGDIPWISSKSLDRFYVSDSEERVTEAGAENGTRLIPPNTILFVVRGMSLANEFRVGITQRSVTFNQDLKGLIANENFDALFLAYMLKAKEQVVMHLADATSHGTLRLQTDVLEQLLIPAPPLPEQRKIARILGAWDRALADLDALIAAKRRQKKGLAQRLLTGRVRMPGFEDEWKEVRLRALGSVVSGGTPSTSNPDYWGGAVAWCTPTDITALDGRKGIHGTTKSITDKGLDASSATLLPEGSLLVTTRATLGLCAVNSVPMATNQGFKSIVPGQRVDVNFLYYTMSYHRSKIERLGAGNTFPEVSKRDFSNIRLSLPPLEEQRRIAAVLDAADAEIAALEDQRNALARQKTGLMQRLLTGEIRVTPDAEDRF